ncbi:MAG: hypothetical protein KTR15_05220 [Phycisphaeraceae bacterium]|nr:hypothetical protein [Phycisphaeraceae bacterium]
MTDGPQLLEAHLNGETLTDEQRVVLSQWVCASPKNARLAAELTHLNEAIALSTKAQSIGPLMGSQETELFKEAFDQDTQAEASEEDELPPIHIESTDPLTKQEYVSALSYVLKHTFTPKRLATMATAAAVLLAAVLTVVLMSGPGDDKQIAQVPDWPSENTPNQQPLAKPTLATITDTVDAQWRRDDTAVDLPVGSRLREWDRLTLTKGFAQITTRRGAEVLLQAPCTIEMTGSDNAVRLHQGKLVGKCLTPSSKGFIVHVPGMDVVDLGTQFGVAAGADGASTVLVMNGSVRAQPTEQSPQAFKPVVLGKDQARRVVPETGSLEMIAVSEAPAFHTEPVHPYTAAVLDAKPLVWLRQNEQDPGTLMGSARFDTLNNGFGAVVLDGRGSVDLGDVLDFEADQPFSISLWVKPVGGQSDAFILGRVAKDQTRNIHGYDVYLKDRRLRLQLTHCFEAKGLQDSHIRVESADQLVADRWQHVAVTYDGSRMARGVKVYVNGSAAATTVQNDSLGRNSIRADTACRIGVRGFAEPNPDIDADQLVLHTAVLLGSPMAGGVGDLVVFGQVLSPNEISRLFAGSENVYSDD